MKPKRLLMPLRATVLGGSVALLTGCATTPPPRVSPDHAEFGALAPPPSVSFADYGALEKLEEWQVLHVISSDKANIKRCAELHQRRDGRSGRVVVSWQVETSGVTTDVAVDSEEWRGSTIGECLVSRGRQWRFPEHRKRSKRIRFPFSF